MLDRESELAAIKQVNLSVIAASHGYEIVRKKSTRSSVLMSSGSDKILISKQGPHYVYCSVYDSGSQGTAIDFAMRVIEPGCSLGRARQLLRPFLNASYVSLAWQQNANRVAKDIRPSRLDLEGVKSRYNRFAPIAEPHAYLCGVRGIPFELLQSQRLAGRVRHCPRRGSIFFPHLGVADGDRRLTGYEIKGPDVSLFSKGGRKGLFISKAFAGDREIVFTEAGIDAVSYLAAQGDRGTRVASTAGRMNQHQHEVVRAAIQHLGEGAVVAAFDNDKAGDRMVEELEQITRSAGTEAFEFREHRPEGRGQDWNQVLREHAGLARNDDWSTRIDMAP